MPTNQHRLFTSYIRKLVGTAVRTDAFPHLKSPNSKSGYTLDIARVNIIARPDDLPKDGERHLEVGKLEVILEITAPFNDPDDWRSGFAFSNRNLRWINGCLFPQMGQPYHMLMDSIHAIRWKLKAFGEDGNYDSLVIAVLNTVDKSMAEYSKVQSLL